jgi:molybdopterin-guanine dinucleotide biosynthesis protein A
VTGRRVSAIVLAGGRSSRFGRDKLAEPIDGRPLLHHAIDAVRPIATEVLVVVSPEGVPKLPHDVVLVRDRSAFEGPLAGLLAGLDATDADLVLVTGGDMPALVPEVIEALLAALEARGSEAAVLAHGGRSRPLPMVLRRELALDAVVRLLDDGERRLGALTDDLVTAVIDEGVWRALDPGAATLRDIDTPDDLRGTHETPAGG